MSKNDPKRQIQFLIDHIDPLGQGVFKSDEKVYFIPKTLPGETGNASIVKSSKGVYFATLNQINQASAIRTQNSCPHFDRCNGCQFLHTDYENEIDFKSTTF